MIGRRSIAALTAASVIVSTSPVAATSPAPAVSSAASASGSASAPRAKSVRDSLTGDALAAFEHGSALVEKKQFAEARAEFERAYALSREPRVLYNVAFCEKALGRYTRAADAIRKSLEARDALPADYVSLATRTLELLEPYIGKLTIEVSEPGSTVYVDGESIGVSPLASPREVDGGEHTVGARHDGFAETIQKIDVPHEGRSVRLVLVPIAGTTSSEVKPVAHLGRLRVLTEDPTSAVLIDGERRGRGEFDGSLPAGEHHVRVLRDGEQVYGSEIVIVEGETKTISIQTASRGEVPTWVWIVGGIVLVGGATAVTVLVVNNNSKTKFEGTGSGNLNPGLAPAALPLLRF
jgi:hypothetical protein